MKSTEIHPVSEPKEQEDKKSAVLAANSVSGFRKQPGKKESSLDYKNTDRKPRQEKKKSGQESRQESREETYPRYLAGSEKNADFEDDGVRKSKEKPKENFVREKQKQKASKDPKFHLDNVSGPDIKRKDYDFGFKDTVTLTRTERGSEAVDQKSEDRFQSQQMPGEDRDTLKTRKKDEKISSKNEVRRGRVKKEQENTRMKKAIRRRMYAFMVNKLSGEEQKDSFAKAAKDIAVMRLDWLSNSLFCIFWGCWGRYWEGWLRLPCPLS